MPWIFDRHFLIQNNPHIPLDNVLRVIFFLHVWSVLFYMKQCRWLVNRIDTHRTRNYLIGITYKNNTFDAIVLN